MQKFFKSCFDDGSEDQDFIETRILPGTSVGPEIGQVTMPPDFIKQFKVERGEIIALIEQILKKESLDLKVKCGNVYGPIKSSVVDRVCENISPTYWSDVFQPDCFIIPLGKDKEYENALRSIFHTDIPVLANCDVEGKISGSGFWLCIPYVPDLKAQLVQLVGNETKVHHGPGLR